MQAIRTMLVCVLSVLGMAGCGGGGGDPGDCFGSADVCGGVTPGPAPGSGSATGMYRGTASDGSAVTGFVFGNSEYWFLYGNATEKRGLWQGTAPFGNGSFISTDLRQVDVSAAGAASGSASGTYVSKASLNASFNALTVTTVNASYDSAGEATATTAGAAGNYAGGAVSGGNLQTATVSVTSGGAVNGLMQFGCQFSGTLLPATGVNAYRVTLSFSGTQCPTNLASGPGIAFLDAGRLNIAVMNAARSNAFIVSAGRV